MTTVLLYTHVFIPKGALSAPVWELKQRYTIYSKYDKPPVRIYRETKDYFGVPRYERKLPVRGEYCVQDMTLMPDVPDWFEFKGTLRPEQQPLYDAFVRALAAGHTGIVFNVGTGVGKSVLTLKCLTHLKTPTLIIVPREFIGEQWREYMLGSRADIPAFTDLRPSDIGIAQQNRCVYKGKKIIIGTVQSLYKDKYPAEFVKSIGCVVTDELHIVGAEEYSKVSGMFPSRYRIGLTATYERPDGMEGVYDLAVAGQIIHGPKPKLRPKVIRRAYTSKYTLDYVFEIRDKVRRRGAVLSALAGDFSRTVLLARMTKTMADSGRQCLVLGERKKLLHEIRELLITRHGMRHDEVGVFIQETKKSERRRILDECKVVLATTQIMSMAVDAPKLAALLFATPLSHVTQAIGRILRIQSGKKQPVVLDVIDMLYPDAVRWAKNREKFYQTEGWEIARLPTTGTR